VRNNSFSDEYAQLSAIVWRDEERYHQAQDEYEAQIARVPLRADYDDDTSYDEAVTAWDEITQTLLDRVKELQLRT